LCASFLKSYNSHREAASKNEDHDRGDSRPVCYQWRIPFYRRRTGTGIGMGRRIHPRTSQARRSALFYKEECAPCHGETLEGNGQTPRAEELGRVIPPLCGDGFKGNWNRKPLSDLFDKMKATMPRDDPGKLGMEQNADLLAFILNFNEFPAGKAELPADPSPLTEIRFDAVKP
jgi:cytochrome c